MGWQVLFCVGWRIVLRIKKRQTLKVCLFCLAGIVGDGQLIWYFLLCLCRAKKRLATFMFYRKWTRGNFLCSKTMTCCPKTSGAKVGSLGAKLGSTGAFSAAGSKFAAFRPTLGSKNGIKSFADLGTFYPFNAPKVTGVKHSGNKGFKSYTLGAFENL